MKEYSLFLIAAIAVAVCAIPVNAAATIMHLDLNDFSGEHVIANHAGTKALVLGQGSLSRDLQFSPDTVSMQFNYFFFNGFHDSYEFTARLFDENGNDIKTFKTRTSGLGTVDWDLAGGFEQESTLGVEFLVASLGDNFDFSLLSIGDAQLENLPKAPTVPVPEPATLLLLGSGLAGFVGSRRLKKSSAKG